MIYPCFSTNRAIKEHDTSSEFLFQTAFQLRIRFKMSSCSVRHCTFFIYFATSKKNVYLVFVAMATEETEETKQACRIASRPSFGRLPIERHRKKPASTAFSVFDVDPSWFTSIFYHARYRNLYQAKNLHCEFKIFERCIGFLSRNWVF